MVCRLRAGPGAGLILARPGQLYRLDLILRSVEAHEGRWSSSSITTIDRYYGLEISFSKHPSYLSSRLSEVIADGYPESGGRGAPSARLET